MEYNMSAAKAKYRRVAEAMGVDTTSMNDDEAAKAAVDAVKALSVEVRIPQHLKELGVQEKDLDALSASALADVCTPGNPRDVTLADIRALYQKAL